MVIGVFLDTTICVCLYCVSVLFFGWCCSLRILHVCCLCGPWYRVLLQVVGWQRNRYTLREKAERDFGKR